MAIGQQPAAASGTRIAADVGGTFTDVAAFDERSGALRLGKTLTTPSAAGRRHRERRRRGLTRFRRCRAVPARHYGRDQHHPGAHRRAHARCSPRRASATFTRSAASTGRNPTICFFSKHKPLIERALRFEIRERIDAARQSADPARRGRAGAPRADPAARGASRPSPSCSCTPIAIRRTNSASKRIVRRHCPGLFVTASHELSQEYREFERTSTTAANAYVGPRVRHYLAEMDQHLGDAGFDGTFLIVQSTGGLFDVDERGAILHPHAGIRAGRRRHRHQDAVRQHRSRRTPSPSTWAARPPRPASFMTATC